MEKISLVPMVFPERRRKEHGENANFPRMNQNTPKSKEEAEREGGASHLVPFRKFNDSSLVGLIEVASFIFIPTQETNRTERGRRQKLDTIGGFCLHRTNSLTNCNDNNKAQRM